MSDLPELYISADSHVVEPKELWLTRMDRRFAFFNRSGAHLRETTLAQRRRLPPSWEAKSM